jgi:hypothetical protein
MLDRTVFDTEAEWLNFTLNERRVEDVGVTEAEVETLLRNALDDVSTVDIRVLARACAVENSPVFSRTPDVLEAIYTDYPEKAQQHLELFESSDPVEQSAAIESFRLMYAGNLPEARIREALETAVAQLPDTTLGSWPIDQSTDHNYRDSEIAGLLKAHSEDHPNLVSDVVSPLLPDADDSHDDYRIVLFDSEMIEASRDIAESDAVSDWDALVDVFTAYLELWNRDEDEPDLMSLSSGQGIRAACYGLAALDATEATSLLRTVAEESNSQNARSAAQGALEKLEDGGR